MSIDRIDYHEGFVNEDVTDMEERYEMGGAHIGYYIEWAYKKGFAPTGTDPQIDAEVQKLINSEITGVQYIIECCDSKFWDADLNEEGLRFTNWAYDTYVENIEKILEHKPYTTRYNKQDYEKVSKYLDKLYAEYSAKRQMQKARAKTNRAVTIKNKVSVGNVAVLVFLFVISAASFSGFIEAGGDGMIPQLILAIMFAVIFCLLLPYVTFDRPYIKLDSRGMCYNKLQGFHIFGKKTFIAWDEIDKIIDSGVVYSIRDGKIQENRTEWMNAGGGVQVVTKSGVHEIGSHMRNINKDIETIKEMWVEYSL